MNFDLAGLAERLDAEHIVRRIAWSVWVMLILSVGTFCVQGANRPKNPSLAPTTAPSAAGRSIPGFGEVAVRVSAGNPLCVATADTPVQQRQGLMTRHDLGGYVGMLFRFTGDTNTAFYMRNTPLPLSVAWFDAAGRFVSAADMDPCPDVDGCTEFHAAGPYRDALEVPRGQLSALGAGPGSTLSIGGACT